MLINYSLGFPEPGILGWLTEVLKGLTEPLVRHCPGHLLHITPDHVTRAGVPWGWIPVEDMASLFVCNTISTTDQAFKGTH